MASSRRTTGSVDAADTDPLDALDDLVDDDAQAQRQREQAATEVACEAVAALATTRRTVRSLPARRCTGRARLSGRRRTHHGQSPLGLVAGVVAVALALAVVVALL